MVSAFVKNFSHGVASEKPHARIFKTTRLVHRFEQRRDVVAEAEAVAVEQLHRVEHFTGGLLVRPAGDVIPEAGLHEAPVSKEKAPDGLGLFARSDSVRLVINTA